MAQPAGGVVQPFGQPGGLVGASVGRAWVGKIVVGEAGIGVAVWRNVGVGGISVGEGRVIGEAVGGISVGAGSVGEMRLGGGCAVAADSRFSGGGAVAGRELPVVQAASKTISRAKAAGERGVRFPAELARLIRGCKCTIVIRIFVFKKISYCHLKGCFRYFFSSFLF